MNREETHALFAQGRDAWNAWAEGMLAERRRLEAAGAWAATRDVFGSLKPGNDATKVWMAAASVEFSTPGQPHTFEQPVDFGGWVFPGNAGFNSATFSGDAGFNSATFSGYAEFNSATFSGDAEFDSATFSGDAVFTSATFSGDAGFTSATFSGYARFDSATFSGYAGFNSATFSGYARFDSATFSGYARFDSATFSGTAGFGRATFSGTAGFNSATFSGYAGFDNATFSGYAGFGQATFEGFTTYADARFEKAANFTAIKSTRAFTLANAVFAQVPDFIQANFAEAPRLDNSHFRWGLVEPGRFWNFPSRAVVGLVKRFFYGDGDRPARYRALKRLAIQGHDGDREQQFFAGEVRSALFTSDWPLPLEPVVAGRARAAWQKWAQDHWLRGLAAFPLLWLPVIPWRASAWNGFFRFWFGMAYQMFSDFGRSILRPLVVWLAAALITAVYCLGQMPEIAEKRHKSPPPTLWRTIETYGNDGLDAWRQGTGCTTRTEIRDIPKADGKAEPAIVVTGLTSAIAEKTNAVTEALHLAFRNAFIILDGGSDAAHRTYGCLYGVERYGDNPVAILPSAVSVASAIQKLVSAVMIFLFGLALRNMLKVK